MRAIDVDNSDIVHDVRRSMLKKIGDPDGEDAVPILLGMIEAIGEVAHVAFHSDKPTHAEEALSVLLLAVRDAFRRGGVRKSWADIIPRQLSATDQWIRDLFASDRMLEVYLDGVKQSRVCWLDMDAGEIEVQDVVFGRVLLTSEGSEVQTKKLRGVVTAEIVKV